MKKTILFPPPATLCAALRAGLFALLAFMFAGCVSTGEAFRSRVESAEILTSVTGDGTGNRTGTFGTKLTFRDPRRQALADNKKAP